MRREMMIILALISLLLAQGNTQSPGRVEHNLTVTDRMIGELAGEVGANTPQQARSYLEQAQALQQQAWTEFGAGNTEQANNFTELARTIAQKVRPAMIKPPGANEQRAMRFLEQNHGLIEQIGSKIANVGTNELREMFDNGCALTKNAEQLLQDGQADAAYKIAQQAQSFLKRVLTQVADASENGKILQSLEKTNQLIEAISSQLCADSPAGAHALLAAASELQHSAEKAYDNGDMRQAAQMTISARKKAQQAQSEACAAVSIENAMRQIAKTRDAIAEIGTPASQDVSSMLSSVRDMLTQADAALSKGDTKAAIEINRSAQKLVGKVLGESDAKPSAESVRKALDMTEKTIADVEPESDAGRQLIQQAQALQKEAEKSYDSGDYSEALNKTRIANRLANQAKDGQ